MVSAPRRLSVFQGRDGLRKTEATVWWEERERMRKRSMDRWVWSGSSQPWWRLMGGWGDKSWEGGSEGVFVRGGTCWKNGIIERERGDGEVNQDHADMMSTARLWNGEQGENHRATVINGKGKLEEEGRWRWWGLLVPALCLWREKRRNRLWSLVLPWALHWSTAATYVYRSSEPLRALLFLSPCPQQLPFQPSLTAVLPDEELTGEMAQRGIKGAA